jgi:putative redox protein
MEHNVKCIWKGEQNFEADLNERFMLNISGEGNGFRPKKLMLAGLLGCTGIDVASLLKKMRAEPEKFEMEVNASLTEEHPKVYDKVHVTYKFYGANLDHDKIEKAVEMSSEKYCGVSAMFRKFAEYSHEIQYHN